MDKKNDLALFLHKMIRWGFDRAANEVMKDGRVVIEDQTLATQRNFSADLTGRRKSISEIKSTGKDVALDDLVLLTFLCGFSDSMTSAHP